MKSLNSDLVSETMDADQGGSDFIDSLPTPEIKTTEDLIAAITPVAPTPKPTDAMLRGKEMSQTQFEGMEPVYDTSPQLERSGQKGALLGYKFPYSQVQDPGMVASYSAPVYGPHNNLVDPGGKFLGYQVDTSKTYDAPKSAEILALEEKFGTTMDPVYATYKQDTRGASKDVEYGPPIGYRFDNGNSQYVSFDATGKYTGTQNREKPGEFGNVLMSVLAIAYPPLTPFIQAYNAVKSIDEGNVLSFIASAAGAGQSIPGLDKNTISLLKDVSTGAKIVQAVESKDPAKIFSAVVNLPNVDPNLKDLSIVVNTAKALNDGNISGAFNGILKMSDRDSIGRLTDKFNNIVDGVTYDINNTPAGNLFDKNGNPLTPEASMGATFEDQIFNDLIKIRNEERDAQNQTNTSDQIDGLNATTDNTKTKTNTSDQIDKLNTTTDNTKTIDKILAAAGLVSTNEDELTNAGLVSSTDGIQKLNSVDVSGKAQSQDKVTDKTIEDELTNAGLFLSTDGIQKLNSVDVSGKALSTTNIAALNTDDIDALINAGLNTLTTADINALNAVTVLGTKDLKPLNTDDIGSLTTADIDTIINAGIDSLDAVTVLGTKDLKALNTDYIDALTNSNITALTTADINALNSVTVLGTKDLKPLNTDYIDALTTKDLQALDTVTILGTKDSTALITKDLTALTTKDLTALTTQSVKTLPKVTLPTIPTQPATPATPKKPVTPAEQLYQTTTQSNPTTPTDIKYFLDMTGGDILPPTTKHDPVESLVNLPMSLEELLHHLRS